MKTLDFQGFYGSYLRFAKSGLHSHLRCDIFDLHTSLLCKVLNLTFLPAMRIIQLKSAFSAMRIFQFYITLTISLKTFQQPHYVTN